MLLQFQRPDHLRVQAVQQMRRRGAKTRREFVLASSPADLSCRFQHENLAAGFSQRCRRDQPVVAAADDDCIK